VQTICHTIGGVSEDTMCLRHINSFGSIICEDECSNLVKLGSFPHMKLSDVFQCLARLQYSHSILDDSAHQEIWTGSSVC
jgi:hypothetical protein